MSNGESWDVNRHTAPCISPVSVVSQCKLASAEGYGNGERRPMGLAAREVLMFDAYMNHRVNVGAL